MSLAEARDPTTAPGRLRELLDRPLHSSVRRVIARNPNLPADLLLAGLARGAVLDYVLNPSLPLLLLERADPALWQQLYQLALRALLPRIGQAQAQRHPDRGVAAALVLLEHVRWFDVRNRSACRRLAEQLRRGQPLSPPDARHRGWHGEEALARLCFQAQRGGLAALSLVGAVEQALGPRQGREALSALLPLCRRLVELLPRQDELTFEALGALESLLGAGEGQPERPLTFQTNRIGSAGHRAVQIVVPTPSPR